MIEFRTEVAKAVAPSTYNQWPVGTDETQAAHWLEKQAEADVPIWAVCCNCDHTALVYPLDLLGPTRQDSKEATTMAERMRCKACGGKACEFRSATSIPEHAA